VCSSGAGAVTNVLLFRNDPQVANNVASGFLKSTRHAGKWTPNRDLVVSSLGLATNVAVVVDRPGPTLLSSGPWTRCWPICWPRCSPTRLAS